MEVPTNLEVRYNSTDSLAGNPAQTNAQMFFRQRFSQINIASS
jgi:hypothetical protein